MRTSQLCHVQLDMHAVYSAGGASDASSPAVATNQEQGGLVWTPSMQRMFTLVKAYVARAKRVGSTGNLHPCFKAPHLGAGSAACLQGSMSPVERACMMHGGHQARTVHRVCEGSAARRAKHSPVLQACGLPPSALWRHEVTAQG